MATKWRDPKALARDESAAVIVGQWPTGSAFSQLVLQGRVEPMRITNKMYTPVEVLAELISAVSATEEQTTQFFVEHKSGHDWLVTEFARKVDVLLDSFRRYGTEVAPTQSVRDNGIDVRLTFSKSDDEEYRVGFQIKSEKEAAADDARRAKGKPGETMVATLKRQAFEADHKGNVHEWWVVACFDLAKHRALVDRINAEVTGGSSPGRLKLRLVNPREAFTLLSMDDNKIDALCTLFLCEDDEIVTRARGDVLGLFPLSQRLIAETLYTGFEGARLISTDQLHALAGEDSTFDQKVQAADQLERIGYLIREDPFYRINPTVLLGVSALYFEARVRHEYEQHEAGEFVHRICTLAVESATGERD